MTSALAPARRLPRPFRQGPHLGGGIRDSLADDVRRGLIERPRWLLPKYLYDARGSALYQRITRLPEYYQARTEVEILRTVGPALVARHRTTELVELGSGSSEKTRVLLQAMCRTGRRHRYLPIDVCPSALLDAAGELATSFPGLRVRALAADFERDLDRVPKRPRAARRMVAFLGGTLGNLHPRQRPSFLRQVAGLLQSGDLLLVGTDLVGDPERIRRAYDDDAGITAEFNRNLLHVVNRELAADFRPDRFEHVAEWVADGRRVEMRLRATRAMGVRIERLDMEVDFDAGEEIVTELCCKFSRDDVARMYHDAGLSLVEWHTDHQARFAISVAGRP